MARVYRTRPRKLTTEHPERTYAKGEGRTRTRRARTGKGQVHYRTFRAPQFYYQNPPGSFYSVAARDRPVTRLDVRALLLSQSAFVRSNFTLPASYDVRYRGTSLRWDIRAMPPARLQERQRGAYSLIEPQRSVTISDEARQALDEKHPGYEPWAQWEAPAGRGEAPEVSVFLRRDARHWFWVRVTKDGGSP